MVSWIYSGPHGTDFATGGTGSVQKCARPAKTARGPPKVRLRCLLSPHAMYLGIGRDRASFDALKVIWGHFDWRGSTHCDHTERSEEVIFGLGFRNWSIISFTDSLASTPFSQCAHESLSESRWKLGLVLCKCARKSKEVVHTRTNFKIEIIQNRWLFHGHKLVNFDKKLEFNH